MSDVLPSLRFWILSMLVCSVAYPALLLGFAEALAPGSARGSLLRGAGGQVVGSALLAQQFEQPGYFWPRPSAAGYDASATGGSNLSPASPELAERVAASLAGLDAEGNRLVPADLVTASGSGMDPHLTRAAARYQVARVASARGIAPERLDALIDTLAADPGGGLGGDHLVNVLRLNLALDRLSSGS